MDSKICSCCGVDKPLTEYHKCKKGPKGVQPKCKICRSNQAAAFYIDHKDKILERTKAHRATDERKETVKSYINRNRKKNRAKDRVNYAIKTGKLTRQPCEVCGAVDHVHAHHDDYDHPLSVRWLCSKHHREWHRLNGEALNPD